MLNEQDLKNLFAENKLDIADNGFSRNTGHRLSAHESLLPKIMMPLCIAAGLSFAVTLMGFANIEAQLLGLVTAVLHLQIPSAASVMTYLGVLFSLGIIGTVLLKTET